MLGKAPPRCSADGSASYNAVISGASSTRERRLAVSHARSACPYYRRGVVHRRKTRKGKKTAFFSRLMFLCGSSESLWFPWHATCTGQEHPSHGRLEDQRGLLRSSWGLSVRVSRHAVEEARAQPQGTSPSYSVPAATPLPRVSTTAKKQMVFARYQERGTVGGQLAMVGGWVGGVITGRVAAGTGRGAG